MTVLALQQWIFNAISLPPPPRLFLIEEGEGNSWEGVEEGARPHEKLMEMYRRVF